MPKPHLFQGLIDDDRCLPARQAQLRDKPHDPVILSVLIGGLVIVMCLPIFKLGAVV